MDRYSRQTAPAATAQFPAFDSHLGYDDQSTSYDNSLPNDDYWCQTCALPFAECLCYAESPASPHQTYSGYNTQESKNYVYQQASYPSKYATSTSSSSSSYYNTPTTPSQASHSTLAPATSSGKGARNSTTTENSSKRGKRKGSMPPEEAREKRLEQNRRSQRSFRDRQTRLVVDLKQKVEILTEENEKLVNELSALGSRDSSRDSKSPGKDYSNY